MLQKIRQFEFIALMASLMSITALCIDAVLPALSDMGKALGTTHPADEQLIITMIFLGMGIGPLAYGPISDSVGRKPVVYIGFLIFGVASLLCVYATNLQTMIIGRILQGIGLSAPRTMSIAMIRDKYSGDYMARIMSFVTVVFILVPIIAPTIGKGILEFSDWKGIFYGQLLISVFVSLWFWQRQAETLPTAYKTPLSFKRVRFGFKEVLKNKQAIGYTLITGFIVGSFMTYLSTAQQIFEVQYDLADQFPFVFGLLAFSVGVAILLNGVLVLKIGMYQLVKIALFTFFAISLTYVILLYNSGNPVIEILIIFLIVQFLAIGFLFGNLRALAMEPMGHVAGVGASVSGFISTILAVPISFWIGTFVTATVLPIFIGFSICALISILILVYINRVT
ncbi:multidrug effflux MFS transporter [Aquimarina sp. ERC-38]|uniref:multidrug effflux MFS transporter n=1 Tax=Aquimarina sp. ERC-38 TaxID=2949996 RepID=UPI002246058A|nr:multidrug effflux MFS transporter [Aquimarina sp. ERC-38]UZO80129.1 multidrug effflux MFS transporter [Aquimarina sp. ERC-38]